MHQIQPTIRFPSAISHPKNIIHIRFTKNENIPFPYTISFPNGQNASVANLKHCRPTGIPIIVICEVYRACRDVILAEKDAPDRLLYRKQHRAEYQLHETTLKELAEFGIHKLPSAKKLQRQQMELEEELASSKKEKQDLQKQQKTLHIIENNFDAMIREAGIKVPEKAPSLPHQPDRSEPLS